MRYSPGDILLFLWSPAGTERDHTGLVVSVEKDTNGNVISITAVEGNRGGGGCTNTKVKIDTYKPDLPYPNDMYILASFLSISEYMQKCGIPAGTKVDFMHYFGNDYDK